MIKILVCGGDGQLGTSFKHLKNNGSKSQFEFYGRNGINITNTNSIETIFNKEKPQFCINCAAFTQVDLAEGKQDEAYLINEKGARNLAEVCNQFGTILLHVSTDYVFDGKNCTPYPENYATKPVSIYGKSKLAGEMAILSLTNNAYIIRTGWLYSQFNKNFLKTIYGLAKNKPELKVVADQVGTPTYAPDLAQSIEQIIDKIVENKNQFHQPGIYHYSNEGVASWYDFAKSIAEFGHLNCKINPCGTEDYPTPAKRPSYSVLSKNKIKSVFQLDIPYWRDSVKKCVNLLKEQE